MQYEAVIGLEIHAQLLTASKIFCGCSTAYGARPNSQVCPVCLGLPGALPVLNRRAVELAIRAALALGCTIAPVSVFARKHYFYPDLPKGYQISQYDRPLATAGLVEYRERDRAVRVGIVRVHLEEDAGKSLHAAFGDGTWASRGGGDVAAARPGATAVDFNRSGVPLIEIVTAPDLRTAADAAGFFARLRAMLVELGVNDGNMEEGSLRCDANVSVRPAGETRLGTKTEVKNLNSFRFLHRALQHEIDRQAAELDAGRRVRHETRLWDVHAGRTVAMRSKEEAHDYRYFPEPDLPPLRVEAGLVSRLRDTLPELPEARKARLVAQFALPEADAALLSESRALAQYFEAAAAEAGDARAAGHWIVGELAHAMKEAGIGIEQVPVTPARLAELIRLLARGDISGPTAKLVFERMFSTGQPAAAIVEAEGLGQVSDEADLERIVRSVLAGQPKSVAQYRAGKTKTFGFLVGAVMKATGGKANPAVVNALLRRILEEQP